MRARRGGRHEKKREEEKSQKERGFQKKKEGPYHAFAFVPYDPPPHTHSQAIQAHTPFHTSCSQCVCARFVQPSPSLRTCLCALVQSEGMGVLEPATSTTCVAPAWRTVDRRCIWWRTFSPRPELLLCIRSSICRRRYDISLTTQNKVIKKY